MLNTSTARALAAACLMAVLYLSLTPLEGWNDRGLPAWQFITEGLPRHWIWSDVLGNLFAYFALGGLLTLSLPFSPRVSGRPAPTNPTNFKSLLLVIVVCSALSWSIEALQTFNPQRYPQLLDWMLNTLGAIVGALLANQSRQRSLNSGKTQSTVNSWLEADSSIGLVLLLIWPLLSYFPQHQLFALGRIINAPFFSTPGSVSHSLLNAQFGPIHFAQVFSLSLGVLAFAHISFEVLRASAPRMTWIVSGVALACALRSIAVNIASRDLPALGWLTIDIQIGLCLGLLGSLYLTRLNPRLRSYLALGNLLLLALLSNLLPYNAYFAWAALPWSTPAWNNLRSTMDLAALLWPYAAVVFLVYRLSNLSGNSSNNAPGSQTR